MYIANNNKGKAPLFVRLNFKGNHSINYDPQRIK